MDYGGLQYREFALRMQKILQTHVQHDLTENDRSALFKAQHQMERYMIFGSLLGPFFGAAPAFYVMRRRAARLAMIGQPVAFGRGGVLFMVFLGGLVGGMAGADLGVLMGARAATKTIDQLGDRERIANAFRAAQADILEEKARDLKGITNAGKVV